MTPMMRFAAALFGFFVLCILLLGLDTAIVFFALFLGMMLDRSVFDALGTYIREQRKKWWLHDVPEWKAWLINMTMNTMKHILRTVLLLMVLMDQHRHHHHQQQQQQRRRQAPVCWIDEEDFNNDNDDDLYLPQQQQQKHDLAENQPPSLRMPENERQVPSDTVLSLPAPEPIVTAVTEDQVVEHLEAITNTNEDETNSKKQEQEVPPHIPRLVCEQQVPTDVPLVLTEFEHDDEQLDEPIVGETVDGDDVAEKEENVPHHIIPPSIDYNEGAEDETTDPLPLQIDSLQEQQPRQRIMEPVVVESVKEDEDEEDGVAGLPDQSREDYKYVLEPIEMDEETKSTRREQEPFMDIQQDKKREGKKRQAKKKVEILTKTQFAKPSSLAAAAANGRREQEPTMDIQQDKKRQAEKKVEIPTKIHFAKPSSLAAAASSGMDWERSPAIHTCDMDWEKSPEIHTCDMDWEQSPEIHTCDMDWERSPTIHTCAMDWEPSPPTWTVRAGMFV